MSQPLILSTKYESAKLASPRFDTPLRAGGLQRAMCAVQQHHASSASWRVTASPPRATESAACELTFFFGRRLRDGAAGMWGMPHAADVHPRRLQRAVLRVQHSQPRSPGSALAQGTPQNHGALCLLNFWPVVRSFSNPRGARSQPGGSRKLRWLRDYINVRCALPALSVLLETLMWCFCLAGMLMGRSQ